MQVVRGRDEARPGRRSPPYRTLCLAAAVTTGSLAASQPPPRGEPETSATAETAREFLFSGDRVSLPIVMVREYPFVAATIAGVPGRLMLDTGCEAALIVNDHRVTLAGGVRAGSGRFGSGETLTRRLHAAVPDVEVGRFRFPVVHQVKGIDARMLEQITPDFLGWLGWRAWAPYTMKLDYRRSAATFYRRGAAPALAGERILAALPFETRKLPNTPVIGTRLAGLNVAVTFDSGQYGGIHTTAAGRRRLLAAGLLKAGPDGKFTLSGLRLAGQPLPAIPAMSVELGRAPAAEPIGIGEPTFVVLGYGFLRSYTSVWDYSGRRLYLTAPRSRDGDAPQTRKKQQ